MYPKKNPLFEAADGKSVFDVEKTNFKIIEEAYTVSKINELSHS